MLEISLKHGDKEIYFSRLPDTVESEAVVAIIRAVLDAHKLQPDIENNQDSSSSKNNNKLHRKPPGEVTVTKNLKAALVAIKRFDKPLKEAREIENLINQDSRYSGKGMETIRYLLRQLEIGGYITKEGDNSRVITVKGKNAAKRFEEEILHFDESEASLDDLTPFPSVAEIEDLIKREDGDYTPPD